MTRLRRSLFIAISAALSWSCVLGVVSWARIVWAATRKAAAAITGNIAGTLHDAAVKATPAGADELALVDSEASWGLKKLTWSALKAAIVSQLTGTTAGKFAAGDKAVNKSNDTGLGGFTVTSKNLGNLGAAVDLAPTDGNIQHGTNNAAVTINAPTTAGVYTIIVEITNTATAGAVTLAGFTQTDGDAFTTTNGKKFVLRIEKLNSITNAFVSAMP